MIDTYYIKQYLVKLGFDEAIVNRYEEPQRFYHNMSHLTDVISYLEYKNTLDDDLFLAAVYHDAVYDPRANDNEEESAKLFLEHAENAKLPAQQIKNIHQYILDTKLHKASSENSQKLMAADLDILNQPLDKLIAYEKKIFKEYQFVDYKTYKVKRVEVLEALNSNGRLDALIAYVKQREPLIALFAGSFNPFHKGHYNVLQKAEKIFDKVIIAFGQNPDKDERDWEIPSSIKNRQIEYYNGLLTDLVASLGEDVVVIRGLRNSTDFQYEQNQYRYIQELMPNIKIVNIFCDKEFEHISSSGIRTLKKYNKHQEYLLH